MLARARRFYGPLTTLHCDGASQPESATLPCEASVAIRLTAMAFSKPAARDLATIAGVLIARAATMPHGYFGIDRTQPSQFSAQK
jgi:hypothetical protein